MLPRSVILAAVHAIPGQLGDLDRVQRDKLSLWFDKKLSDWAIRRPGPWIEVWRGRLRSLAEVVQFELTEDNKIVLTAPGSAMQTLISLERGTLNFRGIENLALVVYTAIFKSEG